METISLRSGTRRFRVLDTLAQTIGRSHSLRSFAEEVKSRHGTGHYPNVRDQLERLAEEGMVSFEKAGRSKVPRLRFDHTGFADTMATLELWRKRILLEEKPIAQEALSSLERRLADNEHVRSLSLAAADRNLKLRRLEPLILLHDSDQGEARQIEAGIAEQMAQLEGDIALRVDAWICPAERFAKRLTARDASPAARILRTQTCIWHPQAFWQSVAEALPHGRGLAPASPIRPASIDEAAIARNLTRWGYEELGRDIEDQATPLCPEVVAIAALGTDRARWTGAAGLVLAKADVEPALLAYLATSEDEGERLAGIVEILHDHAPDPSVEHLLSLFRAMGVEPEQIERDTVLDPIEVYGG